MKKIISLLIINLFIFLCVFPCYAKSKEEKNIETIPLEEICITSSITTEELLAEKATQEELQSQQQATFTMMSAIEIEYTEKLAELEWRKDIMEWFIEYKEMVDKYKDIADEPETIYDVYTDEEIYLMERVIETETYQRDFESKCNVASVILNRVESPYKEFGSSVKEVITTPKQFAYGRKKISEDTKLALEFAFSICDTTNGAIAFHSHKTAKAKWGKWVYTFSDSSHHFYERK